MPPRREPIVRVRRKAPANTGGRGGGPRARPAPVRKVARAVPLVGAPLRGARPRPVSTGGGGGGPRSTHRTLRARPVNTSRPRPRVVRMLQFPSHGGGVPPRRGPGGGIDVGAALRALSHLTGVGQMPWDQLHEGDRRAQALAGGLSAAGRAVSGPLKSTLGPTNRALARSSPLGDLPERTAKGLLDYGTQAPAAAVILADRATRDPAGTAKSLAEPYWQALAHPLRSLEKDPAGTVLLLGGVEGAVGKGVTLAGRTAKATRIPGLAKAGDAISSTGGRAAATVPGTNVRIARSYLPIATRKGAQVVKDRILTAAADRARARAARQEAADMPDRAAANRARAARLDPTVASPGQLRRRTDDIEGATAGASRVRRDVAVRGVNRAVKPTIRRRVTGEKAVPRRQRRLVTTVARGAVAPTRADVRAYVSEIDAARKGDLALPQRIASKSTSRTLRRGSARGVDEKALRTASERLANVVDPLEREAIARGLLDPAQAARAKEIPFMVRQMGARHEGGTIKLAGHTLPTAQAHAARAQSGTVARPVMISEAPGAAGTGAFYRHFTNQSGLSRGPKTGTATLTGTAPARLEAARAQVARLANVNEADAGYKRFVHQFAIKGTEAGDFRAAQQAAREYTAREGIPARVVRVEPFHDRQRVADTLAAAHGSENPDLAVGHTITDALRGALKPDGAAGRYVAIPETVARRLDQHVRLLAPNTAARALRTGQSLFSRAVLFNAKQPAQNLLEGAVRNTVHHAMPIPVVGVFKDARLRSELEKLSPELHRVYAEAVAPGGLAASIRHRPSSVTERALRPVLAPAELFLQATSMLTETPFQRALGHSEALRQIGEGISIVDRLMGRDARKLAQRIAADPNVVYDIARGVRRAYGAYANLSPAGRYLTQFAFPFAPWLVNGVVFAYRTMPVDHPILTSLLEAATQVSADYRRTVGQRTALDSGGVPDWMLGGVRLPGEKATNTLPTWTPWGAVAAVTGEGVANTFFPMFTGSLKALEGTDWKGRRLKDATLAGRLEQAGAQFLGASAPVERVRRAIGDPSTLLPRTEIPPRKAKARVRRRRRRAAAQDPWATGGSSGGSGAPSKDPW